MQKDKQDESGLGDKWKMLSGISGQKLRIKILGDYCFSDMWNWLKSIKKQQLNTQLMIFIFSFQ